MSSTVSSSGPVVTNPYSSGDSRLITDAFSRAQTERRTCPSRSMNGSNHSKTPDRDVMGRRGAGHSAASSSSQSRRASSLTRAMLPPPPAVPPKPENVSVSANDLLTQRGHAEGKSMQMKRMVKRENSETSSGGLGLSQGGSHFIPSYSIFLNLACAYKFEV